MSVAEKVSLAVSRTGVPPCAEERVVSARIAAAPALRPVTELNYPDSVTTTFAFVSW